MRALSTLIRMHRHQLDEKRRALTDLENLRADLIRQREKLEAELAVEQEVAKKVEVGAFAYGGFARGVISRREKLQESLTELEGRIAAAQQDVALAFQDLKRHEIALAAKQRRQREEEDRRAQAELDEVSIEMHRRRTA
jgi:flagellar export protein FliJ